MNNTSLSTFEDFLFYSSRQCTCTFYKSHYQACQPYNYDTYHYIEYADHLKA